MPLNSESITQSILRELKGIGVSSTVNGEDSQTAELVRLIVQKVINAIRNEAQVQVTVQTVGGPTSQAGTGTGRIV